MTDPRTAPIKPPRHAAEVEQFERAVDRLLWCAYRIQESSLKNVQARRDNLDAARANLLSLFTATRQQLKEAAEERAVWIAENQRLTDQLIVARLDAVAASNGWVEGVVEGRGSASAVIRLNSEMLPTGTPVLVRRKDP